MSEATPDNDRHAMKMAKKKAARDKIMATKTDKKGLIIVHTGKGKGKSSAGFGMIFRCIAHDMKCAVVQFIKGGMSTGERDLILSKFSDECAFHTMGEGFTWETQDRERDIAAAENGRKIAKEQILDPEIQHRTAVNGRLSFCIGSKFLNGFRTVFESACKDNVAFFKVKKEGRLVCIH